MDDEGKVIAQRMEYVRSQHSKSGSDVPKNFMDYFIESDVGKTFNSTDGYFEKATTKLMNEMPESGKKNYYELCK